MSDESLLYRIKQLLPSPMRERISAFRRGTRRARLRAGRHWTRRELADDLRRLGVLPGDVLLVHSSLSKLGFVEGGPDAVIDAFLDVLGGTGTLAMPTFPFDTFVAEYLRQNPSFDVRTTPSRMGKLTEVFRVRPGVRRSTHPTHPLGVLGPQAAALTDSHARSRSTFDRDSPFYRLCELGGKILLLGVDFHAMTNLHVVEDLVPTFPYRTYLDTTIEARVRGEDGAEFAMLVPVHDPDLSRLRDCNKMERYFRDGGALVAGKVCEAEARLLDARAVLTIMSDLAARGITMYFDDRVPAEKRRSGAPASPAGR
jgi:aminoglycoside 3-N-acetyltransferase